MNLSQLRTKEMTFIWESDSSSEKSTHSENVYDRSDNNRSQDEQPAGSSSQHARENTEYQQDQELLPSSVRGAPQHMRDAIRRQQNMESARRTRLRKAEALQALINQHHHQVAEISALEERVQNLTRLLEDAGFVVPDKEAIENVIDEDELFKEMLDILDDGVVEEDTLTNEDNDENQHQSSQE